MNFKLIFLFVSAIIHQILCVLPKWQEMTFNNITLSDSVTITGFSHPYMTGVENNKKKLYFKSDPVYDVEFSSLSLATQIISNKYVFCGAEKNLYLLKDGIISMIQNHFEASNNTRPICFYKSYHNPETKIVTVLFSNTQYFNYYESSLVRIYELGKEAYAMMQLYYNEQKSYYFSFVKDSYQYKIKLSGFENRSGWNIKDIAINPSEIFSSNIIDVILDNHNPEIANSNIFIFTYIENTPKFKYYIYSNKALTYEGSMFNLKEIHKMNIIKAGFIPHTGVVILQLSSQEGNYITAIDLMANLVIYNLNKDVTSFNIEPFNTDNHRLFFHVLSKNTVDHLCPFAYNSQQKLCELPTLASTSKLNINNKDGNAIVVSCSNKELNKYCITECPIGYISNLPTCTKCPSEDYYEEGKCVSKCSPGKYVDNNKICYLCSEFGLKLYKNTCINNCSDIFAEEIQDMCIRCQDEGRWYESEKCVNECSNGCEKREENNECKKCKEDNNKVLSRKGKCVDKCGVIEFADKDNVCKLCSEIDITKPFFQNNTCVKECSLGYEANLIDQTCKYCKDHDMFYDKISGKCISKCPAHYLYDSENLCYSCLETDNKYFEIDQCVKECSKGAPTKDEINDTILYCEYCKDKGEFLYDKKCIGECPQYYFNDSDNVCYNCTKFNQKYEEGKCKDDCSEGFAEIVEESKICDYCKSKNLFYKDKKCVNECPLYWTYDNDNICFSCFEKYEDKPFNQNGICVEKCSYASEIYSEHHYCKYCKDFKQFYQTGKCVDTCDKYTALEPNNNECYYCYKRHPDKQFVENKACVFECSRGYELQPGDAYCKSCLENNKVYSKKKCVDVCPIDTVEDENKICNLCYCSSNGKCLNGICDCNVNFFGTYCEMEMINKELAIKSTKETVLSNRENIFSFTPSQSDSNENLDSYSIKWYIDGESEIENDTFINGFKEINFELSKRKLKDNQKNRINVTKTTSSYQWNGCIDVRVHSISLNRFSVFVQKPKANYDNKETLEIVPMKENVNITVIDSEDDNDEALLYQFLYEDEYNQIILLKDYSSERNLFGLLPVTRKVIVNIKNSREENNQISAFITQIKDTEYNTTISDILISNNTLSSEKIKKLKKHFWQLPEIPLNLTEEKNIFEFLKSLFEKEFPLQSNDVKTNEIGSLDSLFSLLNILANKQIGHIDLLNGINNIIRYCINFLNEQTEPNLPDDTIVSIIRNIDTIIDQAISIINNPKANTNDNDNDDELSILNEQKEFISKLTNYISRGLSPGKQVKIIGKHFHIYIDQPGREQKVLSIPKNDKETEERAFNYFSDYTYQYKYQANICNSRTFFCIQEQDYRDLINEITQNKNVAFDQLIFSIIEYNPKLYTELNQTSSIINISIYDPNSNQTIDIFNHLKYTVRVSLKEISNDQGNTTNYACSPFNNILINESYCYSFFDLNAQEAICHCFNVSEMGIVCNELLANYYKHFVQYPEIALGTWNYFSNSIISASIGLLVIISILVLIMDLYADRKERRVKDMTKIQKTKYEYESLKHLAKAGSFKFAWFLTYYKYPLLNVFSIHKYDHPRFFRFFLEMFFMLLSLFISSLPYHLRNFELKDKIIDLRYSIYESWSIHDIPSDFNDYSYGFLCSFIASIIVFILSFFVHYLLKTHIALKSIWKPKLDLLKDYIYNEIKKDVLLCENWNKIRNRMIAVSYFFKSHFERMGETNKQKDKWARYLMLGREKYESKDKQLEMKRIPNYVEMDSDYYSYDSSLLMLSTNNNNEELPTISKYSNKNYDEDENDDILNIGGDNNQSNQKDHLKDTRRCQLEHNFVIKPSQNSNNNYHTINKFEKIKSKYIDKKEYCAYIEEDEEDDNVNDDSPEYKIVKRANYTYLAQSNIQVNRILIEEMKKIFLNVTYVCILLILLIALYVGIIYLFREIYIKYEYFIVRAWLFPSIFQIIVFRFLLSYLFNLIRAIVLSKNTRTPKNIVAKFLYELCIEKYISYLNKIRNLTTKYQKEFSCLE